jgi:hypothetical protein
MKSRVILRNFAQTLQLGYWQKNNKEKKRKLAISNFPCPQRAVKLKFRRGERENVTVQFISDSKN